ncbi:MAG: hypothetical protein V3V01_00200 [Acidimicrobiales bacterium]
MSDTRPSVPWEEARGFIAFLLLAAAVASLFSGVLAMIDADLDSFRRGFIVLVRIPGIRPALLVLGAALLIVTAPARSLSPVLRKSTLILAVIIVAEAVLYGVNILTLDDGSALGRLWPVFNNAGTGVIIGGASAWLCKRVELD